MRPLLQNNNGHPDLKKSSTRSHSYSSNPQLLLGQNKSHLMNFNNMN